MTIFEYNEFFDHKLEVLKKEGKYRYFADLERLAGNFPKAIYRKDGVEREITIWCSNDYLGMGQHPEILQTMQEVIQSTGTGAGGTRNISGTSHYHNLLEETLAEHHHKEAALIFTSGYVANLTTLKTLGDTIKNVHFLSDKKNHNSMIQGMKQSKAKTEVFEHNDMNDLENKLKNIDDDAPKIIVFESIYSMNGHIGNVKEIIKLAKKYNALTYLDEVHAVALYGERGAGIAEQEGVLREIDIIQGTLGKGFGQIGGYIAANKNLVDFIRSCGHGFIFTTALPPHIAAGAMKSIKIVQESPHLRQKIKENSDLLKKKLLEKHIPLIDSACHIVPILVGDAFLCKTAADRLMEAFSIYVQPINYPTVDMGTERLRVTPSPIHQPEMIDEFVHAIDTVWSELHLARTS